MYEGRRGWTVVTVTWVHSDDVHGAGTLPHRRSSGVGKSPLEQARGGLVECQTCDGLRDVDGLRGRDDRGRIRGRSAGGWLCVMDKPKNNMREKERSKIEQIRNNDRNYDCNNHDNDHDHDTRRTAM